MWLARHINNETGISTTEQIGIFQRTRFAYFHTLGGRLKSFFALSDPHHGFRPVGRGREKSVAVELGSD
jgi:hypothetical protein